MKAGDLHNLLLLNLIAFFGKFYCCINKNNTTSFTEVFFEVSVVHCSVQKIIENLIVSAHSPPPFHTDTLTYIYICTLLPETKRTDSDENSPHRLHSFLIFDLLVFVKLDSAYDLM